MNERGVRELVIDALQKVTGALDRPELAPRLEDPDNNFTIADLGLDSLDAIEWCMEIEARTGVEIDPAELVAVKSIDDLVGFIVDGNRRTGITSAAARLVRVSRDAPLPLSLAQEPIWRYCQTPEGSAAYAMHMTDHILGPLDVTVLRDCLTNIVRRHEILRSTFPIVDGEPVQRIHQPESVALPLFHLASEGDRDEQIRRTAKSEMARVSDLNKLPLMRFSLIRLGENEHLLLRVCHHILWDSWSSGLFLNELARLYDARIRGAASPFPDVEALQYADYAAWQREALRCDGPTYRVSIDWWTERFRRDPQSSDLPFKRAARIIGLDPAEGVVRWPLDSALVQRLARLTRDEAATPYLVWLAALVVLLAAETGQPDVVVSSYMTNRRGAEVQNMIGYFIHLVALRFRCDQAMTFRDWLTEVRLTVNEAKAHGEIPYDELRTELRKRGVALPEVQIIVGAPLDQRRAAMQFAGLTLTGPDVSTVAVMPWGFSVNLNEQDDLVECRADFDAGLYDPAGVRRFIGWLCEFLDALSRRPGSSIAELLGSPSYGKEEARIRQLSGV